MFPVSVPLASWFSSPELFLSCLQGPDRDHILHEVLLDPPTTGISPSAEPP
jgi:hypothetical protein